MNFKGKHRKSDAELFSTFAVELAEKDAGLHNFDT